MATMTLENVQRLRLSSIKNTRITIARLIGILNREPSETIDFQKYKLMLEYLKVYLRAFEMEVSFDFGDRIVAIEKQLKLTKVT